MYPTHDYIKRLKQAESDQLHKDREARKKQLLDLVTHSEYVSKWKSHLRLFAENNVDPHTLTVTKQKFGYETKFVLSGTQLSSNKLIEYILCIWNIYRVELISCQKLLRETKKRYPKLLKYYKPVKNTLVLIHPSEQIAELLRFMCSDVARVVFDYLNF